MKIIISRQGKYVNVIVKRCHQIFINSQNCDMQKGAKNGRTQFAPTFSYIVKVLKINIILFTSFKFETIASLN